MAFFHLLLSSQILSNDYSHRQDQQSQQFLQCACCKRALLGCTFRPSRWPPISASQGTSQYWQLASADCLPHGRSQKMPWHSWYSLGGFAEKAETHTLTPSESHMPCWTSGVSKYTTLSLKGAITSPLVIAQQLVSAGSRKPSGRNQEGMSSVQCCAPPS